MALKFIFISFYFFVCIAKPHIQLRDRKKEVHINPEIFRESEELEDSETIQDPSLEQKVVKTGYEKILNEEEKEEKMFHKRGYRKVGKDGIEEGFVEETADFMKTML